MSVAKLLETAQFLVDAGGVRKAVVLDYASWEGLLTQLEDLEDAKEIRRLRVMKRPCPGSQPKPK